jgi:hypothetical protein
MADSDNYADFFFKRDQIKPKKDAIKRRKLFTPHSSSDEEENCENPPQNGISHFLIINGERERRALCLHYLFTAFSCSFQF